MATGLGTLIFNFGSAPGTNLVTTTVTGLTTISADSKVDIYLMGTDGKYHQGFAHSTDPEVIKSILLKALQP